MSLWSYLLPNSQVVVHEDNDVAIRIVRTGRNQTMRHLSRSHGIHIAWLHEMYDRNVFQLVYEPSSSMAADIFTKPFTNQPGWDHVCSLINICDDTCINDLVSNGDRPPPYPQGGTPRKLGVWSINPDGSGTWTRYDPKAVRYRNLWKPGPARHEVTERTTYDATT